jgi:hypothetical protein
MPVRRQLLVVTGCLILSACSQFDPVEDHPFSDEKMASQKYRDELVTTYRALIKVAKIQKHEGEAKRYRTVLGKLLGRSSISETHARVHHGNWTKLGHAANKVYARCLTLHPFMALKH